MTDKAAENVTDPTRLEAMRELVTAKRKAAVVASEVSKVVQKWKKAGVNMQAAQMVAKLRDMDPEEVSDLIRELVRMLALMNVVDLKQEGDLFSGNDDALPKEAIAAQAAWEAEDAGFLAGKAGRAIDSSPYNHQPGSELFVKWRDGWQRGQEAIAYEMGPDTKQASDERRPRGGRKKDATDPAEGTA